MSQVTTNVIPGTQEVVDEKIVQAAVLEISHIATLPEITLKIIRLVEDPNGTAQELNKGISHDPALGARILKVVNSAFYGLPGQIGSINRAIVLLGLNAVKNIAIAASLAKLFRGGQLCPGFNARDLWSHCVAVATGTQLLARYIDLGLPDEAFLAGLIHDIGIMVEAQARRPKFVEAIERMESTPGLSLRQAETLALGANHEQFGGALCRMWKFPAAFAYVTAYHHRPMELAPEHRTLAALVHIADIAASNARLGYVRTVESGQISPEVLEAVNLTPQHVENMTNQLPEALQEPMAMLGEPV